MLTDVNSDFAIGGDKLILQNIRRLCKARGISIKDLEVETGIGNGVIARWAVKNPRIDNVMRVARYFGVTIDELVKENSE